MSNNLLKFLMVPFLFFGLYLFLFTFGIQLIGNFESEENVFWILAGSIVIANFFSFFITLVVYKLFQRFSSILTFKRWYHYSHLIYMYISAVSAAVISLEPILLSEGVVLAPIDNDFKLLMIIFVVIIANYTLFNSVVFNQDFKRKISRNDSHESIF